MKDLIKDSRSCVVLLLAAPRLRITLSLLSLFVFASPVLAQWTNVGIGIDYQQFTVTMSDGKTNRLFVSRMTANNASCIINGMIAKNQVSGAVETVPTQASRYEDAINYWGKSWGQRNDVIVAVNGSFYDIGGTDIITGGQAYDGWYEKRFDYGAQTGFVWKFDRSFFIADCLKTVVNQQTVTLGGGSRNYEAINTARGADDLIVYTPQYNNNTLTDNSGVEVLVELPSPMLMLDSPSGVSGTVRQVRIGQGSTPIPFDHVVLSGAGTAATFLQTRASLGGTVKITADVDHYNVTCNTAAPSLANTYGLTQGYFVFLRNGAIIPTSNSGMIIRNPRTFVAHNASYVFFCVCDGRSSISAGMTSDEMGAFSKNYLAATDGVNYDGGGSSTMWVNGVIRNVPSDGNPRAVANGMMMVNLLPKSISTAFVPGQNVKATGSASLRLGPGSNYATYSTIANNAQGVVVTHQVNGVYAKGSYWWKCNFNGTTGWITQSSLASLPTAPFITQQPSSLSIVAGGTGSFAAGAAGTSPLGYRWQKNQINLSNGGRYSGTTTPTFTLTGVDDNDVASYRCVVTNAYGNTNSISATLSLIPPVPCVGLLNADLEGGFDLGGGGYLANDWTEWEAEPGVVIGYDEIGIVHGGAHSQRIRVWGDTNGSSGGVYQRIPIAAGQPFTFNVWAYSGDGATACSLGVDPAGGTNGVGASWSPATTNVAWTQHTIIGNATANYLTVYYKAATTDNIKRNGYFDDGAPAVTGGSLQLVAQRNDNTLTLTWPECPGSQLERATNLVAPVSWSTVTNQVSTAGGQKSVTLVPSESAGFFRLVVE